MVIQSHSLKEKEERGQGKGGTNRETDDIGAVLGGFRNLRLSSGYIGRFVSADGELNPSELELTSGCSHELERGQR